MSEMKSLKSGCKINWQKKNDKIISISNQDSLIFRYIPKSLIQYPTHFKSVCMYSTTLNILFCLDFAASRNSKDKNSKFLQTEKFNSKV